MLGTVLGLGVTVSDTDTATGHPEGRGQQEGQM